MAVAAAASTGALAGLGLGLLIADGRGWPLLAIAVAAVVVTLLVRAAVPRHLRMSVGAILALSFALHVSAAALIYDYSLATGGGGFITGDDRSYARLATLFAAYLHELPADPPSWGSLSGLFGTWVYLEAAVFYVIGPEPLVAVTANMVFALVAGLLTFDMARRIFDERCGLIGLAIVVLFPSFLAWSSLNLKDALALLLMTGSVWSLVRYHASPRWPYLLLAFAFLFPLESVRSYAFGGLCVLAPVVVFLTPGLAGRRRTVRTAAAAAIALALLLPSPSASHLGTGLFNQLDHTRAALARTANSGFRPTPSPAPTALPAPVKAAETEAAPGTSSGASVAPTAEPARTRRPVLATPPLAVRTVQALWTGLPYSIAAPFPWALRRPLDGLTVPEMLLWYGLLFGAAWTTVRWRREWRRLSPFVLLTVGLVVFLAVAEGNVGGLFRHRSMELPWVALLAAPALATLASRLSSARGPTITAVAEGRI